MAEGGSSPYTPLLSEDVLEGCVGPMLAALQAEAALGSTSGVDVEFALLRGPAKPKAPSPHQSIELLQVRPGRVLLDPARQSEV